MKETEFIILLEIYTEIVIKFELCIWIGEKWKIKFYIEFYEIRKVCVNELHINCEFV